MVPHCCGRGQGRDANLSQRRASGVEQLSGPFFGKGGNMHVRLGNSDFGQLMQGAMDEVRVWKTARTGEQIRENIAKPLTGSEPGLVALWNFDDPANPAAMRRRIITMGNCWAARARRFLPSRMQERRVQAIRWDIQSNAPTRRNGSYVELPADAFNGLEQTTIEGWVNWSAIGRWTRMFDFGAENARVWLGQEGERRTQIRN
jgi:hypothetical protein